MWVPVQDSRCYGVVKCNLDPVNGHPLVLPVRLGEAVIVKGELEEWVYVRRIGSEGGEGILPRSYVHIKECSVIKNGATDIIVPKQPTLSQEIVATLLEWNKIAKQLYIASNCNTDAQSLISYQSQRLKVESNGNGLDRREQDAASKFQTIRGMIHGLHECRKKLLASNLTVEGLKDLKKEVAAIIDSGNSLLKLDMVVRDELGNPLDPLATSTIQLFRQHQSSTQKLKRNARSHRGSRLISRSSHSLIVTVTGINIRIVDECEVRFFLCELAPGQEEPALFTESVQLSLKGVIDQGRKNPFKFLFTDLGKVDLERKRVFLVAYLVRIGPMELKENDSKRDHIPFTDKKNNIQVKRPYAVAAREITDCFRDLNNNEGERLIDIGYMPCSGEDTMDDTLKKVVNSAKDALPNGFLMKLHMVPGNPKEIQEEQPVLLRGQPVIARKLGLPEVILPNDTRNDLYIKLIRGEFHRTAKTSDRNIEVTVSVHNEKGDILPGILYGGNGPAPVDHYRSVVYYHNDKPRWNDHLKISLPMNMDEFSKAHVKFTFKHRSSSDSKDKTEKPFALAYLKLKEEEGTAIRDDLYELSVYKIDPKHYRESEVQYLGLHSIKPPAWYGTPKSSYQGFSYSSKDYFSIKTTLCSTNFTQNADLLQLLDWVTILRKVAEKTKREQPDIDQEGLVTIILEKLRIILEKVTTVAGEEIVKFLVSILDALFLILVDPLEQICTGAEGRRSVYDDLLQSAKTFYETSPVSPASCEHYVFKCLLHIFGLILDHKFQHFQSVLNFYIEENFYSSAYKKLAQQLKYTIETDKPDVVLKVMKSIEFFFKFIIKSYEIHERLKDIECPGTKQELDDTAIDRTIEGLFKAMCILLKKGRPGEKNDPYIGAKGGCFKHLPAVIEDLVRVFSPRRLSEHLVELCCIIPTHKLTNIKLTFLSEIVHSDLFIDTECRFNLLPTVTSNILAHLPGNEEEMRRKSMEVQMMANDKIRKFFGADPSHSAGIGPNDVKSQRDSMHSEETEKSIELFGDVMDILHRQPEESKNSHIWYIMQILLKPIIISINAIPPGDPISVNMIAIFLSLIREMKSYHYHHLINSLKAESASAADPYKQGLLRFLNDVLVVMKNLFNPFYFPADWNTMILLQNRIVLTALENFETTIKDEFAEPLEEQTWNNFFYCTVTFLTQPALQIEEFPQAKQNYILQNFGDMRKRAADLIKVMWFSLGKSKRVRFVPGMVGTFLDMAFVPEPEVRETSIRIFFDMMHCEFDQDRPVKSFKEVEDELIKKIVEGIEGGNGDQSFRDAFYEIMTKLCEHNSTGLRHSGLQMVSTVAILMDLLLQYREVELEEEPGNRMSCIVNLLDFSKEINRKELYLRYLYKLHDLHYRSKNFTEAAFTLKLHSHQLEWSDEEIPQYLRIANRYTNLSTQMELKEALYNECVTYFDTDQMWECALEVCDELRQQYEETYNYAELAKLHKRISDFYSKILKTSRYKLEYFRVAFYGGGFPSFLRDKVFIYRGKQLEQLSVFEGRMLGQYLQAELLRTLGPPPDEIRNSNKQYLQICRVEPVSSSSKRLSGMRGAEESIVSYYQCNEIDKFTYSRPYHQEPRDPDNEFASLCLERYSLWISQSFPGIMSWFPVVRDTVTRIGPLENAIETMESANEGLRKLAVAHHANPTLDMGELTMKLNGTLDAAVMGGVAKYEKAFLSRAYLERNPEDGEKVERLKRLIVERVPILAECLAIHSGKSHTNMKLLHARLEDLFKQHVAHIEQNYGVHCKALRDEKLGHEIELLKRKQAKEKRLHPPPAEPVPNGTGGQRGSVFGKTISSTFSSSTTLYQNSMGSQSFGKSMNTIAKSQNLFRRSTHNSFSGSLEENQFTGAVGVNSGSGFFPHSSTLPRTPHYSSRSRLAPLEAEADSASTGSDSTNSIILTQNLVSHRPPRSQAEQNRNSLKHRLSEISLGEPGLEIGKTVGNNNSNGVNNNSSASEQGSRNSGLNSPDSAIGDGEEAPAPPLPPKLRERQETVPPPPPPKKPTLKQVQDLN